MFHIVLYQPEIPPNTGAAIRLSANTGCELHLVEPLGFSLDEARLRRAGLDYADLARVTVHAGLDAALQAIGPSAVYAFTSHATRSYADVAYRAGDVLLFGPESTGLPAEVAHDERVTERLRVPMAAGSRSLNLSNAAAVAVYEAWRQHGFAGAALTAPQPAAPSTDRPATKRPPG